jgi:hypothetical protein
MKLHDLLGVAAEHQHRNLMLNLLYPASSPTTTSQELCCILNARLFMCRSTNRAEISPAKERRQKWVNGELVWCKHNWFHMWICFDFQTTNYRTMMRMFPKNTSEKAHSELEEKFSVMSTLMHGKLNRAHKNKTISFLLMIYPR